ncbi:MAG: MFS transporter [Burkholderiales bacterium]
MDNPNVNRLIAARAMRAFGDGFVSLLLPLYLIDLGYDSVTVGLLASATLLGSGAMTLGVGLTAHRYDYRTALLAAAVLMAATGVAFASFTSLWPLLVVAVVGTLNPSSGDVSVFIPMEHAVLARSVEDRRRTAVFARYALAGTLMAAVGSLAAGMPSLISEWTGWPQRGCLKAMFVVYALLGVAIALVYRGLPRSLAAAARPVAPLGPSRRAVFTLAALFSLDSFGGGFVVQSLVALWLYQRFGMSPATAGTLFFVTGVMSAFSYLVAVRIAGRIGLVNTMVFTHLPANLCLVAVPFAGSLPVAVALLCVRSLLSQMDVPTRNSYVMAIVTPEERPAAAGVTAVPRSLASAASPLLAGYLLSLSPFGWPLVAAGGFKIVYDLLLLAMFRRVRPREEARK